MQINVLLPTGRRTVDLEELKTLVRQGVVQPSTLLEIGGKQGKAKNVPALKPIFDELAAQRQTTQPSTPKTDAPKPEGASETPDFVAVLRQVGRKDAPTQPPAAENAKNTENATVSGDDLYDLLIDDAPQPESQPSPTPPPASATMQPPTTPGNAPSSGSYYFEAKTPVPFVPKRFRSTKKGFYVDSLKAFRSAELTHLTAWGRGFLRAFDILFVVGVVIYFLVFLTNAGIQGYKSAKARQELQRSETFHRLEGALDELGLSDTPFSELEENKFAWIPLLLANDEALKHEVTAYNFSLKSLEKKFEILEIAEKKSVKLEKEFSKKLSREEKELQSYFKEFRKDLKQAQKLKKEYDSVSFPLSYFLLQMLLALIGASIVVILSAFLYGLATILFRILFSAADLYAASFRDDFDPTANKRRDDLLASVETIKANGTQTATPTSPNVAE